MRNYLLVMIVFAFGGGCSPAFSLREDFYRSSPIWESIFLQKGAAGALAYTKADREQASTQQLERTEQNARLLVAECKVSAYTAPALYVLLKQVDPHNPMLSTPGDDSTLIESFGGREDVTVVDLEGSKTTIPIAKRLKQIADANEDPLPPELANDPLTKAYVVSLAAAFYGANLKSLPPDVRLSAEVSEYKIPDQKFSGRHFKDTGKKFLAANLSIVQNPQLNARRYFRLRQMYVSIPAATVSTPDDGPRGENDVEPLKLAATPMASSPTTITWDGLVFEYFSLFYKGDFVDRGGGKLGKPDIGKKISNETLSAAVTVFFESIVDFAVLSPAINQKAGIRAPIVYTGTATKPEFLTASHNRPTLVSITQKLKGKKTTDPIETVKYVVEPVAHNNAEGISQAKLRVIRFASGGASDIAESLSSLLLRSFGGVNLGFAVMGKISIGDNDTFAKLVETVIGEIVMRSSELGVSHALYNIKFTNAKPDFRNDSPAVLLLKAISYLDD